MGPLERKRTLIFNGPVGLRRASRHPEDLREDWSLDGCERIFFDGCERPSIGGIPLLVKLGKGGMGYVYCGIDPEDGTEVAVKVMPRSIQEAHDTAVDRFVREGRLASQIVSDHLVRVRRAGVDPATQAQFLVMECISGMTAATWAEGYSGNAPVGDALVIMIGATRGLAAAHAAGVIHRDVKPENILIPVGDDGVAQCDRTKLTDLGLAKQKAAQLNLTATATGLGTAGFMAPEQLSDAKRATPAADVFSIGASLYAILTGGAPFAGTTSVMAIVNTMKGEFPPLRARRPDVPAAVEALVHTCLSATADDRHQDAGKLLADLESLR